MIHVEDDGPVRTVTLDRPERRNALTPDALDDLETAVTGAAAGDDTGDDAEDDAGDGATATRDETSVVYLRGAGDAFCAGADLDVVAAVADGTADAEAHEFVRRGQRVADAIESADVVVVAGVNGAARGGGVELALACDLRVATPEATFAEPGVRFGLFGAWGGTVRLPEVVGLGDALDFSLSGRVVDAEEARRMGLVSRVVPDPHAVAEEVAANDPSALGLLKERLRDRASKADRERAEVEAFAALVEEHRETLADRDD